MRALYVALWIAIFSIGLSSQTITPLPCSTACVLQRQQPFTVAYDFAPTALNPDPPDGFYLYQNGAITKTAPASALQNGVIAFNYDNGLPAGSYTFAVSAFTNGGESLGDPVITLTVLKGKPAKPTNGRLQ